MSWVHVVDNNSPLLIPGSKVYIGLLGGLYILETTGTCLGCVSWVHVVCDRQHVVGDRRYVVGNR